LVELGEYQLKLARRALHTLRPGSRSSVSAARAEQSNDMVSFDEAYKSYYWPGPDFVPSTVDTVVSVFRIRNQPLWRIDDPTCGWGARTTAGVDIHTIDSDHFSLLREPYVRVLAQMVSACLARGAGAGKQA
jgi:thioesterase domain-containing protein